MCRNIQALYRQGNGKAGWNDGRVDKKVRFYDRAVAVKPLEGDFKGRRAGRHGIAFICRFFSILLVCSSLTNNCLHKLAQRFRGTLNTSFRHALSRNPALISPQEPPGPRLKNPAGVTNTSDCYAHFCKQVLAILYQSLQLKKRTLSARK